MKIWTTSTLFIFITVFPTWILSCQTHFPAKYIDTYVIYIYNDKCRKPSFLKLMRECHQFVLFLRHSTARFHATHCCIREVSANVLHPVSVVTGGDANVKTWEMQHVKEKWLGTWGWHDVHYQKRVFHGFSILVCLGMLQSSANKQFAKLLRHQLVAIVGFKMI